MSQTKYLLDVSTLVALLWQTHVNNAKAIAWAAGKTLAVCPITELPNFRARDHADTLK